VTTASNRLSWTGEAMEGGEVEVERVEVAKVVVVVVVEAAGVNSEAAMAGAGTLSETVAATLAVAVAGDMLRHVCGAGRPRGEIG
jgi:hypothetical protein